MNPLNDDPILADIGRVTRWLALTAAGLVVASTVFVAIHRLIDDDHWITRKAMKLFYLDLELNVPTFFSTTLLIIAAALLATIFWMKRRNGESGTRPWAILAAGFVLMAFDEVVAAHERLIEPMRLVMGEGDLGILYFAWVVPAFVGVGLIGLGFLKFFFFGLPRRTRFLFGLAATLFLGGAIGFELLEGLHVESNSKETTLYIFLTTVEETFEMAGVIVFIRALVEYLAERYPMVSIQFRMRERH